MVGGEVGAALDGLAGDLDTLTTAPLWQLADAELAAVIRASYAAEQRAAAVGVAALREAAHRGLPVADGAKDAPRWYRGLVPVTTGQAQVRAGPASRS